VAHGSYHGYCALADLRPGEVVVDIGTGRGEMLAVAIEKGASRAIGIEYSEAAVELARRTIAVNGIGDRAEVLHVDARDVPLADGTADLVTLLDVVEHLTPAELATSLVQAHRLLKPGGRLFIHTMPTSTIRKVYHVQRHLVPGRTRRWPRDPRNAEEKAMHVNEQTRTRLRRSLTQAGFRAVVSYGEWVYTGYVPDSSPRAKRLYHHFAKRRITRRLGVCNLMAIATKP
jgi:cyclopropane fatty-acyl-phospholipid synthase-like methyltransferase